MRKNYLLSFLLIFFFLFVFFAFGKYANAQNCSGCGGANCSTYPCNTCFTQCPLPTTYIPSYAPSSFPPREGVINPILPPSLNSAFGSTILQKMITLVINLLFVGGAIVFFIMLLSGGIRWIASGGDKTHLEGAKGQITHAFIGLAILFSAFAIIKLIGALFGVDLLNLSLPSL